MRNCSIAQVANGFRRRWRSWSDAKYARSDCAKGGYPPDSIGVVRATVYSVKQRAEGK